MYYHINQKIVTNKNCEIRVDMRAPTGIKIQANRLAIFMLDKKRREITSIEVGITR
ncbi:hypothetical protein PAEPH01_2156 [Pancytospora epiphaga]|nr:hypothetical protein PAEPH01_2156 [Pancytospora epiphaga]